MASLLNYLGPGGLPQLASKVRWNVGLAMKESIFYQIGLFNEVNNYIQKPIAFLSHGIYPGLQINLLPEWFLFVLLRYDSWFRSNLILKTHKKLSSPSQVLCLIDTPHQSQLGCNGPHRQDDVPHMLPQLDPEFLGRLGNFLPVCPGSKGSILPLLLDGRCFEIH